MNFFFSVFLFGLASLFLGCNDAGVSQSELSQAASRLETAAETTSGPAKERLSVAAKNLHEEDYVAAAGNLHGLALMPGALPPEHQATILEALRTVQRVLAERAQEGDTKAEEALIAIRHMRPGAVPR